MRRLLWLVLVIGCSGSDAGGPSSGSALAAALAGDWHLDSVAAVRLTGDTAFANPTDQHWGYHFDANLTGDPSSGPATGLLTTYDEGQPITGTFALFRTTLQVPYSLNSATVKAFAVTQASASRLTLVDSTYQQGDEVYTEIYKRGLP